MAMNNFSQRALFGAVYVGLLTGATLAGGWWFFLLCLLLVALCLYELYSLSLPGRGKVFRVILLLLALPNFAVQALSEWVYLEQSTFPGSALMQQFLLLWEHNLSRITYLFVFLITLFSVKRDDLLWNTGVFALSLFYVVWPLGALAKWPEILVMYVFVLTWSSDTFAYLGGKALGRHKLYEAVSPGKTWEGFFSGLLGTILVAWVYVYYREMDQLFIYLVAPAVHVAGTLGDLTESLMKRNIGVKDSGNIIPGHGGILDRLDAMLFIIPVVSLLLHLFEIPYQP